MCIKLKGYISWQNSFRNITKMDHIRISSVEEAKVVDDKKVDLLEMTKSGFSAFDM